MMVPKGSTGAAFDNEYCRTGMIYPAQVCNLLWGLSTDASTKNCKYSKVVQLINPENYIIINILVTIDDLVAQNMVGFTYTKLVFSIGGLATDCTPSKVYQTIRVSFNF